ncbi:MAG: LytTR family DNA-binding domain-containing protein [Flavobacteriales bacterium]
MRAFLIEDEPAALERLKQLLSELDSSIQFAGECDSIESALLELPNASMDVIFTDVQLADGNCFEIFENFKPSCPVIFITAYNEHAISAFKVNATDYLLKPLKKAELEIALSKISVNKAPISTGNIDYQKLAQAILEEEGRYNKRYLIRFGEQIRMIQSDEIAYIFTIQKSNFFKTFTGKEYPIDKSLEQLERELDPKKFFRINRQFIVNIKAVGNMHVVSKSRVQLDLTPPYSGEEVIVSTEKSPLFKDWLEA